MFVCEQLGHIFSFLCVNTVDFHRLYQVKTMKVSTKQKFVVDPKNMHSLVTYSLLIQLIPQCNRAATAPPVMSFSGGVFAWKCCIDLISWLLCELIVCVVLAATLLRSEKM